ncbi:hypothetical protein BpHYR1_015493 [Brachionus plicatilis]|uniref:Uncharacterized protein n=1 Tax=Brachionus plicatilis TaxID=10195 RepID=A0A3M7T0J1_BRAPC|nr:hypothetical protein BpHYR1_015493 [Brachionus plicatilis]
MDLSEHIWKIRGIFIRLKNETVDLLGKICLLILFIYQHFKMKIYLVCVQFRKRSLFEDR